MLGFGVVSPISTPFSGSLDLRSRTSSFTGFHSGCCATEEFAATTGTAESAVGGVTSAVRCASGDESFAAGGVGAGVSSRALAVAAGDVCGASASHDLAHQKSDASSATAIPTASRRIDDLRLPEPHGVATAARAGNGAAVRHAAHFQST